MDEITSILRPHMQQLTRPSTADWSILLERQISRFKRVFILVDALDECSENTKDELFSELRQLQSSVKLLITSRPTLSIESELAGVVRLDIQADDLDISKYVEARIDRERRLGRLLRSDLPLQENVIKTIVQNSRGMSVNLLLHPFVGSGMLIPQVPTCSVTNGRRGKEKQQTGHPKGAHDATQGVTLHIRRRNA